MANYLDEYRKRAFELCPMLYVGKDKSIKESLIPFGWECMHGWNRILFELSVKLEELNLRFYDTYKVRIEAVQVKEKFGTLRFYYDVRCDEDQCENAEKDEKTVEFERKRRLVAAYMETLADEYIAQADRECFGVCEECGAQIDDEERVETKGYIQYICKKCDAKRSINYAILSIEQMESGLDDKKKAEFGALKSEWKSHMENGDYLTDEDIGKYREKFEMFKQSAVSDRESENKESTDGK